MKYALDVAAAINYGSSLEKVSIFLLNKNRAWLVTLRCIQSSLEDKVWAPQRHPQGSNWISRQRSCWTFMVRNNGGQKRTKLKLVGVVMHRHIKAQVLGSFKNLIPSPPSIRSHTKTGQDWVCLLPGQKRHDPDNMRLPWRPVWLCILIDFFTEATPLNYSWAHPLEKQALLLLPRQRRHLPGVTPARNHIWDSRPWSGTDAPCCCSQEPYLKSEEHNVSTVFVESLMCPNSSSRFSSVAITSDFQIKAVTRRGCFTQLLFKVKRWKKFPSFACFCFHESQMSGWKRKKMQQSSQARHDNRKWNRCH